MTAVFSIKKHQKNQMYSPQFFFLLFYEQVYWLQFGRYFARGPIVSLLRLVFQEDLFQGITQQLPVGVPSVHMLCEPQPTACDTIYSNILPEFLFCYQFLFFFFVFYFLLVLEISFSNVHLYFIFSFFHLYGGLPSYIQRLEVASGKILQSFGYLLFQDRDDIALELAMGDE